MSVDADAFALLEQALASPDAAAYVRASPADVAVRDRALAMLAHEGSAALRTGMAPRLAMPAPLPDRIGAYRVTGLIGQGGMGAVYRAERAAGDFEHAVAIKLVRPGAFADDLSERFARERQTLARLSHPNIARLFDGGATAAGQPYIVMELVDGVPLDRWIAADPSEPARAALFIAVCEAVGFAHRNLIVHRDLTPANVLVTPAGAPKLIDFGIARPVDEAPAAAAGAAAGPAQTLTPGFAAPERFLPGHPATTSSDIYSLGKLLDHLFPAPRARDLDAIIAKATATEPDARYAAANALAADVARWRDRLPVAARGGGRGYVLGRFVARNRLPVAAAAGALLLLVAALIATLVANARAEAARADAEARFTQTRALARVMMFDIYDAVGRVPGSTEARFLLARTAQHYLDSLAADRNAPADVRLDVGEGYARLARVVGFTSGGSLGRREEGRKLFDRAQTVLTRLHADRPDDRAATIALGALLATRAGERLYSEGDSKTARAEAIRARTLLAALRDPDARAAGALANAYLYEGDSWGWDNDIPAAGRVYARGIARVAAMPAGLRDSKEVRSALAGLYRQSGEVYRYAKDPDRAIARMRQAVGVNRTLVADSRGEPAAIRRLGLALWSLGDMYRVAGRLDAALATLNEAQANARKVVAAGGGDAGAREAIAISGTVLAQVQSARGDHRAALAIADESVAIRSDLERRSGGNKGSRLSLAVGLKDVAPVYRAAGDPARTCAALARARALMLPYKTAGQLSDYDTQNNLLPVEAALTAC